MFIIIVIRKLMDSGDQSTDKPKAKKAKIDDHIEESCSICQEAFDDESIFIAPCKHKFHFTCAIKLFGENKDSNKDTTCPLCRHTLAAEQKAIVAMYELPSGIHRLNVKHRTMIKATPSDFNYSVPDQSESSITLVFQTGEYNNWRFKNKEFNLVIDSDNFSNIQCAMSKVDKMNNMLESNKLRAIAHCNYCSRLLLGQTPGWKRCTYCGYIFCCRVCEEDYGHCRHSCREGQMVDLRY